MSFAELANLNIETILCLTKRITAFIVSMKISEETELQLLKQLRAQRTDSEKKHSNSVVFEAKKMAQIELPPFSVPVSELL